MYVLALSNSACLPASSYSGRHVLAFAALCGLVALFCAVLAVLRYSTSSCSLSARLRCRTLIGTYLLCGFVRADCCNVLCCARGTVIQCKCDLVLDDNMLVHGTKTKWPTKAKTGKIWIWLPLLRKVLNTVFLKEFSGVKTGRDFSLSLPYHDPKN